MSSFLIISVLIISALLGGVIALRIGGKSGKGISFALAFAGAYLLSITIVDLIPSLFGNISAILGGGLILAGFFAQQFLEFLSSGVEHGHLHNHNSTQAHRNSILILISLGVHAVLEGGILASPDNHFSHSQLSVLMGISLHKIPAAFALVSIIMSRSGNRGMALSYLTIFSLASPAGYLIMKMISPGLSGYIDVYGFLMAIVVGSFLHISTTIVFEGSPQHRLSAVRLIAAVLGFGLALGSIMLH